MPHPLYYPPLPYCVSDDEDRPWSTHLAGAWHAREHYEWALQRGIREPTITDNNNEDITEWVLSVTEKETD